MEINLVWIIYIYTRDARVKSFILRGLLTPSHDMIPPLYTSHFSLLRGPLEHYRALSPRRHSQPLNNPLE
jgi:hypothetical protein